jgi:hypothetical protein
MYKSLLLALALASALSIGSAQAQTTEQPEGTLRDNQIMFVVTSNHSNIVDLEFYANGRNAAWPGGNQVYSIKDSATHYYVLNCRRGEKICYGAGVRGRYSTYWGVGIGDKHGCTGCCYTCEGTSSKHIFLDP